MVSATPSFTRKVKPKRQRDKSPIDMHRVATIILGGGQGTRLYPLTLSRCKPAVSFGGKGRLIDIPMSNSINSGCDKIFVVSQFLSSSLHQHIIRTYQQGSYSSGFIELLSAEQKPTPSGWFQGPADAVRENVEYFIETPADYFLILSGDQLYNMDFRNILRVAKTSNADLVIASLLVDRNNASRMGLIKIDENQAIVGFKEKPKSEEELQSMRIQDQILSFMDREGQDKELFLGSMGIYLFKREALLRLLEQDPREDFGKHLIPTQVAKGNTYAYIFDDYWEDIGTIEAFYKANIALTQPQPEFNWYDEANPIYTSHPNLPPPKFFDTQVKHSIICDGSIVDATEVSNSILGYRTVVGKDTIIRDSYVMGNDFYEAPIPSERLPENLTIGRNCRIERAILDKHVFLGDNVQLVNKNKLMEYDSDDLFVRDGIIILKRSARIPDGFIF